MIYSALPRAKFAPSSQPFFPPGEEGLIPGWLISYG